jgi:co-chaperonin GroES (HSP10)
MNSKVEAEKLSPQGDYIIIEKMDYNKEETTESGIIIKQSQLLDSIFLTAKILSLGPGLPLPTGDIPEVGYEEGSIIMYDVRGRQGDIPNFDLIRREHVVAVVEE